MLTLLWLCVMGAVAAVTAVAVVLPLLLVAGLFKLAFWPIRIAFRVLRAVLFAPLVALVAVVGIAVALIVGVVALALPLLPFMLLAGFGWAVYRVSTCGAAAAPSSDAWNA